MNATPEIWKPVVGYEGRYEVSNIGRVRSIERIVQGGRTPTAFRTVPAKIRALSVNADGHLRVTLHKESQRKIFFVHSLVLAAFVGPRPDRDSEIRHLNGNPADNRVENLAYGTHAENVADMMRHGTHRNSRKTRCIQGHEFNARNTYIRPDGNRDCKVCAKLRADRYKLQA